jgi:hypothetical protein
MTIEDLKQWIPRRLVHENKTVYYHSPNHQIHLTLGGNIYAFNLAIGKFSVSWEAPYE